jgi:hypothetical protein
MPEKPEKSLEAFSPLQNTNRSAFGKAEPSDFERSLGSFFSLYLLRGPISITDNCRVACRFRDTGHLRFFKIAFGVVESFA